MNAQKTPPKKENGKQKELPQISAQDANDALNEIYLTGSSSKYQDMTEEQFLEILQSMPDESMKEKTAEYFEFELGKKYNFIFEGMGTNEFTDPRTGEMIEKEVVKISDPKTKQKFIHGAAVLVSACKKLQQIPCFIRVIVGNEKRDGKQGQYLDIRILTF